MRQTGDQNAVPTSDCPAPRDSASRNADAAALIGEHPDVASAKKIHVVKERRRAPSQTSLQDRQAARIHRLVVTGGFAVLYLVALGAFCLLRLVDLLALQVAAVLVCISFVFFYYCFASGLNLKAASQNLGMPITLTAIGIMLVVVYLAPVTQILMTPFLFLIMAFVMHRMSPGTMLKLILASLGACAVVVATQYVQRGDTRLLTLQCAHMLALGFTLPGFAMLAGRVKRLHSALFKANRKIKDIEEDAQRDVLLGCFNRRYIVAALEQQKRLADETGAQLCLAVIDLDHFKRVNDEAGHLGGDEVLRTFAGIAQANVRQCDIFGRYGGEEFLLILPETSLLAALNIAERIRAQVEQHAWSDKLSNRVTVSIGLTQHIPGESVLDLFSRTDTAMYMAKQGGRNQVVVEEPVGDAALA